MAQTNELDIDLLRSLLAYDPQTGRISWLVNRGKRVKAGDLAGSVNSRGYLQVKVCQRNFTSHRLAWAIHHGAWPEGEVDHINGVKTDNRIANLRDVPRTLNAQNILRGRRNNKQGLLGVSPNGDRWKASIRHEGRQVHLGTFDTTHEAHAAYVAAKREFHPGGTL